MGLNIPSTPHKRIVVIGGGFAGIEFAKQLHNKPVQVVILDKHNYHTFQPLLYQVATAGLEPDSIAYPLRRVFAKSPNCYFRLAEVKGIITDKKMVITNIGSIDYDELVIATGSKTNFFSLDNVKHELMPMKTIPQALNLRSLILQNFEKACLTNNYNKQDELMNVVIVGGGPTGVELAGALGEMKKHVLPKDYPELDLDIMDIHLFQGGDRILMGMDEVSSKKALTYLEKLGVHVHLDTRVEKFENNQVILGDGKRVNADTVIWAAGVTGNLINGLPDTSIVRGRLKVNAYQEIEGLKNIYAIGDIAVMMSDELPYGHPMVAQVAIQQGTNLAKNLLLQMDNKTLKPFKYDDKGSMATIGRNKAVVELPFFKFQGFFAWFVWMFVHIWALIGFRNRVTVFVNWVYSYFTYNRALRLIIRPFKKM